MFSFLFFLSFSSLALVASVGFEREGLGHSVCPCHCIWCIGLSSPRDTWKLQVEKLITLGCLVPLSLLLLGVLDTLELVPLGCLGALDGWWCSELNHCGVKLRASVGVSN